MAVYAGMKFTTTAEFLKFDYKKWTVANKKAIFAAMKAAAKQWLQTIVERVPKDSGFLLSSFDNLAAALNVGIKGKKINAKPSLYAQKVKQKDLEDRFKNLRDRAVAKGYLEKRTAPGRKRATLRPALEKPKTRKEILEDSKKYKKKKLPQSQKIGRKRALNKTHEAQDEGLHIQKTFEDGAKQHPIQYRKQKNEEYYKREYDKRQAAKTIRQLKKIQKQLDKQKAITARTAQREPAIKMTKRPTYYKWEKVEKDVIIKQRKVVDKPNPAYPTSALALIKAKKAGTLPPKTIQVEETVDVITKRTVRRRIKTGSEKDIVNVYQHHYYPTKKVKGPLKTPYSGRIYGTQAKDVFSLETESGRDAIGQELSNINKGGFEVPSKQGIVFPKDFSASTSQDLAALRATQQAKVIFNFGYNTNINYYRIMDLFNGYTRNKKRINPRGAPWRSLSMANKSYMTFLRNAIKPALIPFSSFIVKSKGSLVTAGFSGSV